MPAPQTTDQRRAFILAIIAAEGGAYILPEQNRQPDPKLRIASIHCRGRIGIGRSEAEAQADWLRQVYAPAPGQAVAS